MFSLILIRGLPGAGKTTLAKMLSDHGKWPVFSVDDFFTDPQTGAYEFHFEKNYLAYEHCQTNVEKAMRAMSEKIFVDNTFTLEWELEPYFSLAARYNYTVFVVTVENRHGGKNTHGIAAEQIEKMAKKYNVVLF
jgi:predicted kinase